MPKSTYACLALASFSLAACSGEVADIENLDTAEGAASKATMVGDFDLHARSLDEAFLADGAVSTLSITKDNKGACSYKAIQAKSCGTTPCTDTGILGDTKHSSRLAGACTFAGNALTLKTSGPDLVFHVGSSSHKGDAGFLFTSATKQNKAGKEAFFRRTSRTPIDALGRAYQGGFNEALSKPIKTNDPSLSPAVRAGLAALEKQIDKPITDIDRWIEDSYAVFATPFDDSPVAYAIETSHSGDHCGGYQVFAVDTNGKALKDVLSDGDCGL